MLPFPFCFLLQSSFIASSSHETVIHQFLKCRLSLVHSRRERRLPLYIYTSSRRHRDMNIIPFNPWSWNVILFPPYPSPFKRRKGKRLNVKAYITAFPSSHISFNSTYCFIFTFFLIPSSRKPFFLLIISSRRPSPSNLFLCQRAKPFFSCSYTLLSYFTLINK